eukprot:CAMPEP_0170483682 /NCGR_PEP_ID=MMETSP0208-20121228/3321_1 /TAXON_ID=197538 /ORGANISM="Strombidium inclinatum, Strain S3" /LENGTH=191 /DNA_ID=CAMNT_0010756811 /DNA_START=371 /DNA_END=946 /DNA_ORIENTATION=+
MGPRERPNDTRMRVLHFLEQIELVGVSPSLEQQDLPVSGNSKKHGVALGELHLDYSQMLVARKPAGGHGLLELAIGSLACSDAPDDDICILLALGLASTCGHVSLVGSGQAEDFEGVAVQFLCFRPQSLAQQHVFDGRLSQMLPNVRVVHVARVGEDGRGVYVLVGVGGLLLILEELAHAGVGDAEGVVAE